MELQPNLAAVPFFLSAAVASVLVALAIRRRDSPLALPFAAMMAGEGSWAFFEAAELVVVDLRVKAVCFGLRVVGAVVTISGLYTFVLRYAGQDRWARPDRLAIVLAPMVLLIGAAWTNPWHGLYWRAFTLGEYGGCLVVVPAYGPLFYTHLGYCYLLVAIATLLLAVSVRRSFGRHRAHAAVMLAGVMVPWVVNIVDLTQVFGYIYVDSVAIAFGLAGLAMLPALSRFGLLELVPAARFRAFQVMADPVIVLDPDGRLVDLNSAAAALIGRPLGEAYGSPASEVFDNWPEMSGLGEPSSLPAEFDVERPLDGRTFAVRVSRLEGFARVAAGWVVVLRDISERRRAELEEAARREAEAADLAKDRFLATLSHELRTPLTPVLATVTSMLDDDQVVDPLRSVLEMIRRNVGLQARLIDDLLDLTRIRSGKLELRREPTDVHELIGQVLEIIDDELSTARLRLVLELHAPAPNVQADPLRLEQVLWNLLKNAIKFTPPGGTIVVRTHPLDEGPGGPAKPGLRIEIQDHGIGIRPEDLPRIFNIFEQGGDITSRRVGGLGLGLSISRVIVEAHGGLLSASSQGDGLGSTFSIDLDAIPATDLPRSAPASERPSPTPRQAPSRSLSILLVEDNRDTRDFLARILTMRGHQVVTADSMAGALQVCAGEIDLLISDIELPDGSGLELIRRLRDRLGRPIPGIALSGFGAPDDLAASRDAGFSEHLIKPIDFRVMEAAIERILLPSRSD